MPRRGDKIKSGYTTLPSRGHTSGHNCYVTPAVSGVPRRGDKIRSGCITPAFMGGSQVGEITSSPVRSRGSPEEGTKSKVATSPLPSPGAHTWAKWLCHPGVPGGAWNSGHNQKWPHHPCLLRGPALGWNGYVTRAFPGRPGRGDTIKSGYITPTFAGAHKWAESLRSWGSLEVATKSDVGASPLPSQGHTSRHNCYVTPAASGVPRRGDKIRSGCTTCAFMGGSQVGRIATSPLCSWGFPEERTK